MRQTAQTKEIFAQSEPFLKFRRPLVRQIAELLSAKAGYHTICEIGTGNGMFLDYLSSQFPQIKNFVGIDLNKEQILDNKHSYKDTGLEFVHAEILDWVSSQCKEGTIFVTTGTFIYFPQRELEKLLEVIHNKMNQAAIAISEPINIDLNNYTGSKPRGDASYSHNYPYLFKQHGYNIFRQELQHVDSKIPFYDNVLMIATT